MLFCDVDIAFIRNPYLDFPEDGDILVQYGQGEINNSVAYQAGHERPQGNVGDEFQYMCSGFFLARSSENSFLFFEAALLLLEEKFEDKYYDQDAFNEVYTQGSRAKIIVLDPLRFPNGGIFRRSSSYQKTVKKSLRIIHANYAVGLEDKKQLLFEAGGWYLDGQQLWWRAFKKRLDGISFYQFLKRVVKTVVKKQ